MTVLYLGFAEPVADSLYKLGWLYMQADNKPEAIQKLQTLVDSYPKDHNVPQARKLLEQLKGS